MNIITGLILFSSLLVQLSFQEKFQGELIQIQTLTRNGERTPLYPFNFYDANNTLSEMTENGIKQMKEFGAWLRKNYSLLPNVYHKKDISIITSDTKRTVLSARATMTTLFSNEFVPIQTIYPTEDYFLQMTVNCHLSKYDFSYKLGAHIVGRRIDKLQPFVDLLQAAAKHHEGLTGAFKVCDSLDALKKMKYKIPNWVNDTTDEKCRKVMNDRITFKYGRKLLTRFLGGPLAITMKHDMVKRVDSFIHKKYRLQMIGYFAHATTIAALLEHLESFNNIQPPYASSLIFELYFDHTAPVQNLEPMSKFFVRLLYRNDTNVPAHVLKIGICNEENSLHPDYCRFDIFHRALENSSFTNFDAACKWNNGKRFRKKKQNKKNVKTKKGASVSVGF